MALIRDIAQQALVTGYLTVSAENQLRQLLRTKYGWEDLNAFMRLQAAAMAGQVRQESRELMYSQNVPSFRIADELREERSYSCS